MKITNDTEIYRRKVRCYYRKNLSVIHFFTNKNFYSLSKVYAIVFYSTENSQNYFRHAQLFLELKSFK